MRSSRARRARRRRSSCSPSPVARSDVTSPAYRRSMNSDIAVLRRAVDDAARIIADITPAQLDGPTPGERFPFGRLVDPLSPGIDAFAVRLDGCAPSTDMTWSTVGPRLAAA